MVHGGPKAIGASNGGKTDRSFGGADQIEGYGKGAMIGEDGELEHGALWHAPGVMPCVS